ncbi:MAG TPA: alpha-glucuronidase family glycosyl hydrolase [Opitutus sp.]|nr:alpha-glucuronidase family glycosyl hydrolase [Opitutus sp.]
MRLPALLTFTLTLTFTSALRAEDGYRLWLRYDPIADSALRDAYTSAITEISVATDPAPNPFFRSRTLDVARDELVTGLSGLLGEKIPVAEKPTRDGAVVIGTPRDPEIASLVSERDLRAIGEEGYLLRRVETPSAGHRILIVGNREIGALYGAFAFLRQLQTHQPIDHLDLHSAPKIDRRLLDHWDNLDRMVERGYAGFSLWEWFQLPDYVNPRYRDYARACSSIGLNGTVLNNVNADPLILTEPWLRKVAALAAVFRPYGIRVYLSVRWSAPVELDHLKTADPLDPAVAAWWQQKVAEIYKIIPDFGGFLVKANSEGEPGPQDYHRTHADGANVLADALEPFGGIVMWRAFVYSADNHEDRVKQAYDEFMPLDGKFRDNVTIQIKNGPLDFMPREPFHPLFGGLAHTPMDLELQITQEYLGQGVQLCYLAPLWKEVLDADTFAVPQASPPASPKDAGGTPALPGASSRKPARPTVARAIDGTLRGNTLTVIAGVANTGTDRDWTGHPLAQANLYAYGRLAWDHDLSAAAIAGEWARMTYSNDPRVVNPLTSMLLASREAVVDYSMPLGLAHLMATGHHYGPGPWVADLKRADWNPVYYHRADAGGLGFDRTATGSNAVSQYAPELAQRWSDLATCPDNLLLWFHHLPWDYKMRSGRTLWDELCLHYQQGVESVRDFQKTWNGLKPFIDDERFEHVKSLLARQEKDAATWRDACLLYFGQFSKKPLPAGVEKPAHDLAYYESVRLHDMPGHRGD